MENKYLYIVTQCINWSIFDDNWEVDEEQNGQEVIEGAPLPNAMYSEFARSIETVIEEFKKNVSEKKNIVFDVNRDFLSGEEQTDPEEITIYLVEGLCRLFEIEVSLFDEKKTHYERQALQARLYQHWTYLDDLLEALKRNIEIWDNDLNEINETWDRFKKYISFIRNKSNREWVSERSFFEPYEHLIKLEWMLDPQKRKYQRASSSNTKDIEGLIKKYYDSCIGLYPHTNLITECRKKDVEIDFLNVNAVDLYIYFWYLKNFQYDEKNHFLAYRDMVNIYEEYYKVHKKPQKSSIEQEIYETNKTYFSNYLVSTLWCAILNDGRLLNMNRDQIDEVVHQCEDLILESRSSYFTHHKLARLYLHTAKLYIKRWFYRKNKDGEPISTFAEIKELLDDAKNNIWVSMTKYGTPDGALLRFYPDIEIIKASKIYSLSGFIQFYGSNFDTRILKLQFDSNEASMDFLLAKQKEENVEMIKKQVEMSESRVSKGHTETLWIFAAFVLFVSWNIQIYQYVWWIKSAIVFMIGFGMSILSFVLVLRRAQINKSILILTGILLISTIIYLLAGDDYPLYNDKYIDHFKEELFKDLKEKKDLPMGIQNAIESYSK